MRTARVQQEEEADKNINEIQCHEGKSLKQGIICAYDLNLMLYRGREYPFHLSEQTYSLIYDL